jgi:hypothetical protein
LSMVRWLFFFLTPSLLWMQNNLAKEEKSYNPIEFWDRLYDVYD